MKILHCADLHLDSKMNILRDTDKAKARRAELLRNFDRMVSYAIDEGIKDILIAGDMFDTGTVSATARKTVKNTIDANPEIHFYYLKGNHDRDNFISGMESIPDNLFLFSDDKWTEYRLGTHITLNGAELNASNADILYNSLVLNQDCFNIVMLHGQESEARPGDRTVAVSLPALRNKGIDYLALGHIHGYREGILDRRGAYCYPGCLEGRGYDETGRHGFVVLDIDEASHSFTRTFVDFAVRTVEEIDVDISECISNVDIVTKICSEVTFNIENYLKINLVGAMDVERDDIDIEYITGCLSGKTYHIKVKDMTTLRVNLDDYLFEESLKGEFVRMVQVQDLSDEEKAAVIRYGFEAISGGKLDS